MRQGGAHTHAGIGGMAAPTSSCRAANLGRAGLCRTPIPLNQIPSTKLRGFLGARGCHEPSLALSDDGEYLSLRYTFLAEKTLIFSGPQP